MFGVTIMTYYKRVCGAQNWNVIYDKKLKICWWFAWMLYVYCLRIALKDIHECCEGVLLPCIVWMRSYAISIHRNVPDWITWKSFGFCCCFAKFRNYSANYTMHAYCYKTVLFQLWMQFPKCARSLKHSHAEATSFPLKKETHKFRCTLKAFKQCNSWIEHPHKNGGNLVVIVMISVGWMLPHL